MRCPFCTAEKENLKVIDSRTCDNGKSIRRRRECLDCGKRFTTYERVEQTTRLMVVKKNGERKPFDKDKILSGLERACYKRPISELELLRVADEVEDEVKAGYDREVPTDVIGQLVIDKLRRLDQVAYVRFASVYRRFSTLEELVDEARAVIDARRYEDPPGQGRLFVDPNGAVAPAAPEGPAPARGAAANDKGGPRRANGKRGPAASTAPAAAAAGTPSGESE